MHTFSSIAVFATALLAAPILRADLLIENAWIRTAPPGAKMLAGYANLINNTEEKITIVTVESDDFGLIEIHETRNVNGLSSMHQLVNVEIAAGETRQFKPLGSHFMLMKPKRNLQDGAIVTIFLVLESKQRVSAEFLVKRDDNP